MTRWSLFAGFLALATLALVSLTRASAGVTDEASAVERVPTTALLANVALSQGVLGALVLFAAWYAAVPPDALGLVWSRAAALVGLVAGVVLYAVDELLAALAARLGVPHSETLRDLLAPTTRGEWGVLLFAVLPLVAAFEELLFRGALVGGLAAGFGASPWLFAAGSSLLFGYAHGAQGVGGMVVTTLLGFALAALFVVTGSLVAVVIAHYLVNALEFVVHEGYGVRWAEAGGG